MIGRCTVVSGTVTVPNSTFSAGDVVSIYNDSGSAITITAAANKAIQVDLPGLIGLKYIKLVSTATQTAERVLTVVSKPI